MPLGSNLWKVTIFSVAEIILRRLSERSINSCSRRYFSSGLSTRASPSAKISSLGLEMSSLILSSMRKGLTSGVPGLKARITAGIIGRLALIPGVWHFSPSSLFTEMVAVS